MRKWGIHLSGGGDRTHDQMVNSHLLYRWATPECHRRIRAFIAKSTLSLGYLGIARESCIRNFNPFARDFSLFNVPRTGLEPARRSALGSKPSMSTSSITSARLSLLGEGAGILRIPTLKASFFQVFCSPFFSYWKWRRGSVYSQKKETNLHLRTVVRRSS